MDSQRFTAINNKQGDIAGGTGITIGSDGKTINHSNSVTAQTSYVGSSTAVPRLKFDAQGHITGVTTVTIYPPTTAGTAGQVWTSDGSGQGYWADTLSDLEITQTMGTGTSGPKNFVAKWNINNPGGRSATLNYSVYSNYGDFDEPYIKITTGSTVTDLSGHTDRSGSLTISAKDLAQCKLSIYLGGSYVRVDSATLQFGSCVYNLL